MNSSALLVPASLLAAFCWASSALPAQEQEPSTNDSFVTQEDFDNILRDYDAALDEIDDTLALLDALRPGSRDFMIAGYMTMEYEDPVDGPSAFSAEWSPVFLWRLREDLLVEGELEIGLEDGAFEVEYIQALYVLNDFLTVGAGKFLSPLGQFRERLHPTWINKLPSAPLHAGHSGLVPGTLVGVQLRGGVRTGASQWNYVVFAANGPAEGAGGHGGGGHGGGIPGFVEFHGDGTDLSQNKAIGGRLGFLPVPWLELGASAYSGEPSDATGASVGDLSLYLFDFTAQDSTPLGYARLDGEFVAAALDEHETERWNGGYLQAALRPSFGDAGLSAFEGVVRYDWLGFPSDIPSIEEPSRWTAGLNYWLDESTVIKLAVERLDVDGERLNTIVLQAAIGF